MRVGTARDLIAAWKSPVSRLLYGDRLHFRFFSSRSSASWSPSQLSSTLSSLVSLNDEQCQLVEGIRSFIDAHVLPIANQVDRENACPKEIWKKMGELGVLGITVSEEYGGLGKGYFEHVLAMEEISRGSGSIGLSFGAHSNLCVNQIYRNGSPKQREKYLPKLVSGDWIGALAMSEAGSGSDVMSMKCNAVKTEGGYMINGTKMWITNGPDADVIFLYARTSPTAISAFLVEKGMQGFSTCQKLDKLGMRGSNTCELVFDNCFVPGENLVGQEGQGSHILMSGLDYERSVLSGGPLGLMQYALEIAVPYTNVRSQFGRRIGEFELIQGKIADMYTKFCASRAYVYSVAKSCDVGNRDNKDCAGAILFAAERATEVALDAIQCLGGNGYINEYPAGRLLRDAKLYEIGAGTSEIRRMLIGREFNKLFPKD